MSSDKTPFRKWEEKLEKLGLGLNAGHDHHILKYGFSYAELEDLYQDTEESLNPSAHQHQVHLYQQELNRQSHASRSAQRAALRKAKQELKAKIWGKSTG